MRIDCGFVSTGGLSGPFKCMGMNVYDSELIDLYAVTQIGNT